MFSVIHADKQVIFKDKKSISGELLPKVKAVKSGSS
jgi:hypothetical protein